MTSILVGLTILITAVMLTLAVMAVLEWRWRRWYRREAEKPLATPVWRAGKCAGCGKRHDRLADNGLGRWLCPTCTTRELCES